MRNTPRRVLAIASHGAYWVQLMRLRPALAGADVAYVTVDPARRAEVGDARFYVVSDVLGHSRRHALVLALRMAWIVLRERPDVVITTGALPGYFGVLAGRLLGARAAWIDSLENVDQLSPTGRKAGRWANLWLTQWPALAEAVGPHYEGSVL